MRVVIDTNILISATFWAGKPKQLLNAVRRGEVSFLTSEILLEELEEVLTAEDKPFKLKKEEAGRVVDHLRKLAEVVSIESAVSVCRDDKDNCVLECARDGEANYVVTGDSDLLDLEPFEGVKIVKVADFLEVIQKEQDYP